MLVSDKWQGRGLGKELLARLLIVGADEKLAALTADILPDNRDVMRICEKLGFTLKHSLDDEVVRAEFLLQSPDLRSRPGLLRRGTVPAHEVVPHAASPVAAPLR